MARGCVVEQRQRARAALEALAADPRVPPGGTSLIAPEADPRGAWVITAVCEADHVPPAVLATLAEHGLAVVDVDTPAPGHRTVTAEVPR